MFLGHFAVGLGAKAAAPRVSLGHLFVASQFIDLLWPTLLLVGLEEVVIAPGTTAVTPLDFTHYPITHSLLAVLGWSLLIGGLYWLWRRSLRGAAVLGGLVVSHWLLDLIVHRPDLPLYPGGEAHVGFGVWNSLPATLLVEGLLFAVGVALYLRVTRATGRAGRWGFWALVVALAGIYLANLFGPPPPSVAAIAWAGQLQWIFVAWAYWLDTRRVSRDRYAPVGAPAAESSVAGTS
jgi:membrane-bound metal-dependent hydrolase YbcI (DUF457 family)